MPDIKISAMTAAAALAGSEIVPLVQAGVNKRATTQAIADLGRGGLISSGILSSPVEYLDFSLSINYMKFRLEIWDLKFHGIDLFAAAFSFDNGVTFLNDTENSDSYDGIGVTNSDYLHGTSPGDTVLFDTVKIDSASLIPQIVLLDIFPGSTSHLASVIGRFCSIFSAYEIYQWSDEFCFVNPAATVTPTPARATTIRIIPDGNGDVNPPTSGNTITSASWALFGIPVP